MLQELYIKDFTIIDDLRLEFGNGLNLITGETGAGKSIIIDALQTLLGGKGFQENIRTGAKESIIEGIFLISPNFPLTKKYLDLSYIQEGDDQLIVRRVISNSGRNRSYINGNMVNLPTLSELSNALLEIHGQNEQISLFKKSVQLSFLDSFAGLEQTKESYDRLFFQWGQLSASLQDLKDKEIEKKARRDFLLFQAGELEAANLDQEEESRLAIERDVLAKSEFLIQKFEEATYLLSESEESAILTTVQIVCRDLADLATVDPRAESILQMISSAQIQLKEGAALLREYREKLEYHPEKLETIEKRLFSLSQLKKKYSSSIPELVALLDSTKNELNKLNDMESDIHSLQSELFEIEGKLETLADELSKGRKEASADLEQRVIRDLKALKINQPVFKVQFLPSTPDTRFTRSGKEEVIFLISMNPGFDPGEIQKVVSGGELSRLMLVLKTILSQSESVPVLIFDEIDTGVGGGVAEFIGKKLWRLSKNKQVFCITHLPQIACFGEYHFNISKKIKKGKTEVAVRLLNDQDRVNEIVRMLGGNSISANTVKYAEELIANTAQK